MEENLLDVDELIELARREILLKEGAKAEVLLRAAYARIYGRLTPLHLKVIDILSSLAESLDLQGKVRESELVRAFVSEMNPKNKSILSTDL